VSTRWHPSLNKNSIKMRRFFFFVVTILALSLFVSCKNDKSVQNTGDEVYVMQLDAKDTIEVFSLTEKYLDYLKQGNLDGALSMLNYLDSDGKIQPVPEKVAMRHRSTLENFLGLNYRIDHVTFLKETDCELKYVATLFEKKEGDNRPNEIGFYIRPMRIDGKWYLTLADYFSDTHESVIKH